MIKIKKICLVVLCVFLLTGFCSCGFLAKAKDKDFSKAGMTITLTDQFTEQENVSQTVYYVSLTSIVTGLKEETKIFEDAGYGSLTLKEYAELVIKGNSLNSQVSEKDGLTYFTYEKSVSGKDYKYYATVFKGADAFWLIQFGCEQKNFDKYQPDYVKWAKTVQV